MPQPEIDLELVDTNDLVNELLSRFDHGVICAMKTPVDGEQHVIRRWRGNSMTIAGLCQSANLNVLDEWESEARGDAIGDDTDLDDFSDVELADDDE